MEAYRIADEPRPGGLAQLAVNPVWPLMAVMFAGPWLAWPWFFVNGLAVGSPTLRREAGVALSGFAGSVVLLLGIGLLLGTGILEAWTRDYLLLGLTVWKLGVSYWLYALQGRSFGLYEYYGGEVKNGMFVVMISLLVDRRLSAALLEWNPFVMMVLT